MFCCLSIRIFSSPHNDVPCLSPDYRFFLVDALLRHCAPYVWLCRELDGFTLIFFCFSFSFFFCLRSLFPFSSDFLSLSLFFSLVLFSPNTPYFLLLMMVMMMLCCMRRCGVFGRMLVCVVAEWRVSQLMNRNVYVSFSLFFFSVFLPHPAEDGTSVGKNSFVFKRGRPLSFSVLCLIAVL